MTDQSALFHEVLAADAARRAAPGYAPPAAAITADDSPKGWEMRFRLVNSWPRETKPAFDAVRAELAPFGYTLSPLHPAPDLSHPRMLCELTRIVPGDSQHYAPLVFELEPGASRVRVFVRQFGGRAVPDFVERFLDMGKPADVAEIAALLQAYVVTMVKPRAHAAAA